MYHYLRKARDIYAEQGAVATLRSALRYVPVAINNAAFTLTNDAGTHVVDEDWDTLVILDGCRYDMFAERVDRDGQLESRVSLGSSSEEFLERNFGQRTCHDTVYVNANPFLPRLELDQGTFHAVVDCLSEWNPDLQTVPPEPVTDAATRAHERYPNKRLIVHYMQPHAPFIGEFGQKLAGGGMTMGRDIETEEGIWEQLREGRDIDLDDVWRAYDENLGVVMSAVERLLETIDGRTVLTADHGNLVGERLWPISRAKYGHPYGVHTEALVKVPWFVIEGATRRAVRADPPVERDGTDVSGAELKDRLEALGYR